MKNIVITAANSFIGRRLCRAYSHKGYHVYAVVRDKFMDLQVFEGLDNIHVIHCDMENYHRLARMVGEECDIGIALAWEGTRGGGRSDRNKQQNSLKHSMESVKGFADLGCRVIVSAGSQAEYGPQKSQEKVAETADCRPNTEYGKYKLQFYDQTKAVCDKRGIRFIEPRYFSLYGEDDSEKTMLIYLVENMLNNQPCRLTGCSQTWDYLHVDDAVSALLMLIEGEKNEGVFNFGTGASKELRQYVEEAKKILKSKSRLEFGAVPYPETGIVHTNPSVEKLKSAVGWKPQISFAEGVLRIAGCRRGGVGTLSWQGQMVSTGGLERETGSI